MEVYEHKSLRFTISSDSFIHSFIHSVEGLTSNPQPLPKQVLHTVRSSDSYFNLQYPLVSLVVQ